MRNFSILFVYSVLPVQFHDPFRSEMAQPPGKKPKMPRYQFSKGAITHADFIRGCDSKHFPPWANQRDTQEQDARNSLRMNFFIVRTRRRTVNTF